MTLHYSEKVCYLLRVHSTREGERSVRTWLSLYLTDGVLIAAVGIKVLVCVVLERTRPGGVAHLFLKTAGFDVDRLFRFDPDSGPEFGEPMGDRPLRDRAVLSSGPADTQRRSREAPGELWLLPPLPASTDGDPRSKAC